MEGPGGGEAQGVADPKKVTFTIRTYLHTGGGGIEPSTTAVPQNYGALGLVKHISSAFINLGNMNAW
jgi:hypothetical protein